MSTTKYKLAEQARRIISGGSPTRDSQVSMQELIICIGQAFANAVKTSLFENKREGESDINGSFIYTFEDQQATLDTKKNLYYTELPSTYVNLPNNLGLYQVCDMQDQTDPYVQVPNNFLSLSRGLLVSGMQGRRIFFPEGNRIYFPNTNITQDFSVMIKMVASLDTIDEDEAIGIPPDIQSQIIEQAVNLYMVQQQAPKDITNDNKKI